MSAREKAIGPCRRCGSIGRLCDSHIIPEFAYRPIYDKDSRAMAIGQNAPNVESRSSRGSKSVCSVSVVRSSSTSLKLRSNGFGAIRRGFRRRLTLPT